MLRYRLTRTTDPEERLEDAALWKALHDTFGDGVSLYEDPERQRDPLVRVDTSPVHVLGPADLLLGRQRRDERAWPTPKLTTQYISYWEDPVFTEAARRGFSLHDFYGAVAAARRLHAEGKGAFVKSTLTKHYTQAIPPGLDPMEAIGDMAYSLIDRGECVMVQELVPMEFETRFLVLDRQVVSWSPVATWLTPLDTRDVAGKVARTPSSRELTNDPGAVEAMTEFASGLAARLEAPDCVLDVCLSGGEPMAIELNAPWIGGFGLYAIDVRAIAEGVRDILLPRHSREARESSPTAPAALP